MKTVLCYGDSNTHGYNPENKRRFPMDVRWPGRLQSLLPEDYHVVEEGCNGRTTIFTDPAEAWKRGIDYLKPCLNSHKPIRYFVLMLGTNDLKKFYNASVEDSARGISEIIDTVKSFTSEKQKQPAEIILIAPIHIRKGISKSPFAGSFDEAAAAESHSFAEVFSALAAEKDCHFLDASEYAEASAFDCLHMAAESHARLAEAVAKLIMSI